MINSLGSALPQTPQITEGDSGSFPLWDSRTVLARTGICIPSVAEPMASQQDRRARKGDGHVEGSLLVALACSPQGCCMCRCGGKAGRPDSGFYGPNPCSTMVSGATVPTRGQDSLVSDVARTFSLSEGLSLCCLLSGKSRPW